MKINEIVIGECFLKNAACLSLGECIHHGGTETLRKDLTQRALRIAKYTESRRSLRLWGNSASRPSFKSSLKKQT
jgi:hypothetical protein